MDPILSSNDIELELRHLRVFEALLREQNLTRAARTLNVTQPSISKTLAHLRLYFSDPLFVRVGSGIAPTAKALELEPAVRALLDQVTCCMLGMCPSIRRRRGERFASVCSTLA